MSERSLGPMLGRRIGAAMLLLVGLGAGLGLTLVRGQVEFTTGDCLPPRGYAGGGYRCYTIGHPYAAIGVLIVLASLVAGAVRWRLSGRRCS